MIYVIGSLRSPRPQEVANILRADGHEVFDDWQAAGPLADDSWRDYEKARGHTFKEALQGYAAKNVFDFDKRHLDRCDAAVLVLPAGKSGHIELCYVKWFLGKPGYILLDDPERWDVMYQFMDTTRGIFDGSGVIETVEELRACFSPFPGLRPYRSYSESSLML